MSAHLVPVTEPRRNLVSLSARLALLRAELDDYQRDLHAAIETPFGIARQLEEAEEVQRYDHDEDVWEGHDGSPS